MRTFSNADMIDSLIEEISGCNCIIPFSSCEVLIKACIKNSRLPKYLSNFPYFTGFSAHSLVK